MAEHETSIGASDEWYTPRDIFKALGERFDLDPCSPGADHWVPADRVYTALDDGLTQPWETHKCDGIRRTAFVFMNPPFGGRNGQVPWLKKFLEHGHGIGLVRAYTSSAWFHDYATKADAMLFPRGKTKFIRPDGTVGKSPGHGVVLLGMGTRAMRALQRSKLGMYVRLK
jgi:hypothetical protein